MTCFCTVGFSALFLGAVKLQSLLEPVVSEHCSSLFADTSSAEAVNWLESQGITMISATADGGLITSAVESGQTITLTGQ